MAINVQINDNSACITMPSVLGFNMHNKFKNSYTGHHSRRSFLTSLLFAVWRGA